MRLQSVVLGLILVPAVAAAQMEGMHEGHGDVGRVHFPTSCNPSARPLIERGVALLHSFWFEEAGRTFGAAVQADSECAMAWWGVASSNLHPLWAAPSPAEKRAGVDAVAHAMAVVTPTPRERGYVDAIAAYFGDSGDTRPHAARLAAWADALRRLAETEPADTEAQIFRALGLIAIQPKTDTSYAELRQAADILEPLFAAMPQHPGLAHYLIHAYDAPPLVGRALRAAEAYALIAPAVPHALHMPSHSYTLLGMWDSSIAANRRSAQAARQFEAAQHLDGAWDQRLHALDYLVYAYLQKGMTAAADRTVREVAAVTRTFPAGSGTGDYALAAMPARYALERGDWAAAARLEPRPSPLPLVRAVTVFARALGAARAGDTAAARASLAEFPALEAAAASGTDPYAAGMIRVSRLASSAWLMLAAGDTAGALRTAAQAADEEEASLKNPLTPGPLLSARELQGDLLLAAGRPADAVTAYRAALAHTPRRRRSLAGGVAAARLAGDTAAARGWRRELAGL